MIRKFSEKSALFIQKNLPDAFIIAIVLSILTFVFGVIFTGQNSFEMLQHWENGFWKLLAFSMQMTLIIVTGHTLASSSPVRSLLFKISQYTSSSTSSIIVVTVVSLIASWINWGFGLVVGALVAKEIASKNKNVHYPLLVASAYSGFLVWHAGLSGSIPLKIASEKGLAKFSNGVLTQAVPTTLTIFDVSTLILVLVLFVAIPLVNTLMHPKSNIIPYNVPKKENIKTEKTNDIGSKLENSVSLNIVFCLLGFIVIFSYFIKNGFKINLNIVNFTFLFLGMLFHKTPRNFLNSVNESIKSVSGVVLQFPLYAGIMGMMTGVGTSGSLASMISNFFVSISNQNTFQLFTFLSAGIVNIFVPSGGGQLAVQGPVIFPAAIQLGIEPAKAAMAIAWGDAWTNMIQPFWALPLLAVAKLSVKDIMGYCLTVLIVSGIIISIGMVLI